MNVFFLSPSPQISARQQCDKHVVKMVLESAQLLCTTHRELEGDDSADQLGLYKRTHTNHPSAVWARSTGGNWTWLCSHALELCREYTYRYGKRHKSQDIIERCIDNEPSLPEEDMTPPPQCMPEEFQVHDDVAPGNDAVKAYRQYYALGKSQTIDMRWTKRRIPVWFEDLSELEF